MVRPIISAILAKFSTQVKTEETSGPFGAVFTLHVVGQGLGAELDVPELVRVAA